MSVIHFFTVCFLLLFLIGGGVALTIGTFWIVSQAAKEFGFVEEEKPALIDQEPIKVYSPRQTRKPPPSLVVVERV